jgi:hypothetical protein
MNSNRFMIFSTVAVAAVVLLFASGPIVGTNKHQLTPSTTSTTDIITTISTTITTSTTDITCISTTATTKT